MPNSPLEELLIDQLRDVYDAEKQLTKALPKLAKAAGDEELAECFRSHAQETKEQAGRIEQVFEALGVRAKGKPCEAMKGLVAEGQEVLTEELEEPVMDIALIAAGRRVEHYEMAAYDSMIMLAQSLKRADVVSLLKETLGEETTADKKLVAVAKRLVKDAAKPVQAEAPPSSKAAKGKQASSSAKKSGKSKSGGDHASNTTVEHEEIRQWAEERGGKPACVEGTGGKGDIGLLRIEFPGKPNAKDDKLSEISWDDFFEKFDERGLALVYQEQTASGQKSNFNKLISRETESKSKRSAG